MDESTVSGISLERAVAYLRSRQQTGLNDAVHGLGRLRITCSAAEIMQRYMPGEFSTVRGDLVPVSDLLHDDISDSDISDTAYIEAIVSREIEKLFPIDGDLLFEDIINYEGGSFSMKISPQGSWRSFDDWDYAMSNPDDLSDGESVIILAEMLDKGVDMDIWVNVCERFKWPTIWPRCAESNLYYHVDGDKFIELLKEKGLGVFVSAFYMAWRCHDNPFLDWTEEDAYTEGISFSASSISKMVESWKLAQPAIEQYQLSVAALKDKPGLVRKIIKLWDSCVIFKDGTRRPKTLMQTFAEENGIEMDWPEEE